MVKLVVLFTNQTVACWDEYDQMIPALSGDWSKKRKAVIDNLNAATEVRRMVSLGKPYIHMNHSEL